MNHLKFCPNCGKKQLIFDGEKKISCPECHFSLYHNCAAAVAVVIKCGDEILLTRRNQNPAKGKLDLSGGFVDPKESSEETCQRELYEEMKLEVDISRLKFICTLPNIYHYNDIDYNTLDIFFEYEVDHQFNVELEQSELSEVVWIKTKDLNIDDLAFNSQKVFFRKYLNFL